MATNIPQCFKLTFEGGGSYSKCVKCIYQTKDITQKFSSFENFSGCFLLDFHFLNLVETWNKSRGKFIQKKYMWQWQRLTNYGIFHNYPTSKSPRKTFLSRLFLNLPTDIAGNCSTKLNKQTISNDVFYEALGS